MKVLKITGITLLIVFIVAQFFGPDKNEGDIDSVKDFLAETNPPETVKSILKNTCFDCHSNHTRYPWYNKITPINYWLVEHIEDGKKHFNVSRWNAYSTKQKDHKLEELAEEVEVKEMPLPSYTWIHADADLSQEQIKAVKEWVEFARIKYAFKKHAE